MFEFKETINCFSVPQCPGHVVSSFRLLLMTTAQLAKATNYCPDLRDTDLKRLVTGNKLNCFDLSSSSPISLSLISHHRNMSVILSENFELFNDPD